MPEAFRRIALIPAYEPDEKLTALLRALSAEDCDVIVVDDGSSDKCAPVFEAAKAYAEVLVHPQNRGKGAALRTGFAYIKEHYQVPYVIVTLDADGQHTLPDAFACCEKAEAVPGSLVLGCRTFKGDIPFRSRFGNGLTKLVFRLSSGVAVSDTQTGLRAFTNDLTDLMLDIPGDRYEYEMNQLMLCAKERVPFQEVLIETIYIDDNASSHFHPIRDSIRIYAEILKFSLSSLSCFALDYVLYCIMIAIGCPEWFANVSARLFSSFVNFTLNRIFVFRAKVSVWKAALQYFSLAAFILLMNTVLLYLFVDLIGFNPYFAKFLTELSLFIISWLVQKLIIFRKKKKK